MDHKKWQLILCPNINPLSANPTKWSNTLKEFVGNSQRIICARLTILWDWLLKG